MAEECACKKEGRKSMCMALMVDVSILLCLICVEYEEAAVVFSSFSVSPCMPFYLISK